MVVSFVCVDVDGVWCVAYTVMIGVSAVVVAPIVAFNPIVPEAHRLFDVGLIWVIVEKIVATDSVIRRSFEPNAVFVVS
jgi:hypothetical protein